MSTLTFAFLALSILGDGPVPYADMTLVPARITGIDTENFVVTVKQGRKEIEVSYGDALFYRHEVEKLSDIPEGTLMTTFARITKMTRTIDYLEQLVLLVAGPYHRSKYPESNREKPHWNSGPLQITDEGRTFWIQKMILHCGSDRQVCVVKDSRIEHFYEEKKGKIVGKPMFMVGRTGEKTVEGKKEPTFELLWMILPTKEIPKKEYEYILAPWRLDQEKHAGKR